MSRPEFPIGTPLPVSAIHRINEEQRAYDADPEGYERREREHQEQMRMEEEEMRHQERMEYERYMEEQQAEDMHRQAEEDQLPF
jgi:hypothetical protein